MVSPLTALTALMSFGIVMFIIGAVRRQPDSLNIFLVANRNIGTWVGALSVASTWIWAPALFIAAQKAFQQGLPGLMWFTVPNVGCLVMFAFIAPRIRNAFPKGYTLPQYIAHRFDTKTHAVYLFAFLCLQICSLAVQLIAGAALFNTISGFPYMIGVILLAVTFTSYSLIDGLRASIRTDLFQMIIILASMVILVPWAIIKGGGWMAVASGFGGFSGEFTSILDPYVAYSFGITVTIGLMSGPVGDQQHWQRAFSFKEGHVRKGYLVGALIFAVVPLGMSFLGFIAAGNPDAAPAIYAGAVPAQQVGPEVIRTLLPSWCLLVFMVMILCGLASTGDSALCAGGSLIAVDIYRKYIRPEASDKETLRISRIAVFGIALVAVSIALIPGITILSLFLFYGTLRSSTLMPTLVMIFKKDVSASGMFWGVLLAIIFGLPMYIYGVLSNNIHIKVGANIGIIIISLLLPLFAATIQKAKKEKKEESSL